MSNRIRSTRLLGRYGRFPTDLKSFLPGLKVLQENWVAKPAFLGYELAFHSIRRIMQSG